MDLPLDLAAGLEGLLGGPVRGWRPIHAGMTPSVKGELRTTEDARVFVKAISEGVSPVGREVFRREARIDAVLPPGLPRPTLLASGDYGPWTILVFDFLPAADSGGPAALLALTDVATSVATAQVPPSRALRPYVDVWRDDYGGWSRIAEAGLEPPGVVAAPWSKGLLQQLVDAERRWPEVAAGGCLLHGDLSLDNLIVSSNGPLLVDWSNACVGAPWLDLVALTPTLLRAGEDPARLFHTHPLTAGVPEVDLISFLCALTGYWAESLLTAPTDDGLPGLADLYLEELQTSFAWVAAHL